MILKFSIIIPCYNHGQYLSDCLDSIIGQSFSNWESIIINDGSIDNSKEVGECYVKKDSRFILLNQSNQGLSVSRNKGIQNSKGDFLLFLDADDWLEPNCLEVLVRNISKHPGFELYRFGYSYWSEPKGNKLHIHLPKGEGMVYPDILYHNIGPCHSIAIKSDFARILGGFDIQLKSCEDWDYWIRAGKMGAKVFSVPENLVAYRYVIDSMSRQPYTMYEALSIVSRRAFQKDSRLPDSAFHASISEGNFKAILKKHLICCIGILIHQGNVREATDWYLQESKENNLKVSETDWMGLSSYLTWKYFNSEVDLMRLKEVVKFSIRDFFILIGYSNHSSIILSAKIMLPQEKKMNHIKYGRKLGGFVNKFLNKG